MRRMSKKTAARASECREFRRALIQEVGICECCGYDPQRPRPGGIRWRLDAHEIANGPARLRCLDKKFAILCACWYCNAHILTDKKTWPVSRQLWALRRSRPRDYSLEKYLAEFHPRAPRAITQAEVDAWEEEAG